MPQRPPSTPPVAFADEPFREDPAEGCYVLATVQGARFALPRGSDFRVDHVPGPAEPLLWVADIVAGAVRTSHQGGAVPLELLGERVHLLEVRTGC